jgi:hypothetical protein
MPNLTVLAGTRSDRRCLVERSGFGATAAASGRLCVGGRFCHSKFCATLIAVSITRSDFMEKKCALVCWFVRIV